MISTHSQSIFFNSFSCSKTNIRQNYWIFLFPTYFSIILSCLIFLSHFDFEFFLSSFHFFAFYTFAPRTMIIITHPIFSNVFYLTFRSSLIRSYSYPFVPAAFFLSSCQSAYYIVFFFFLFLHRYLSSFFSFLFLWSVSFSFFHAKVFLDSLFLFPHSLCSNSSCYFPYFHFCLLLRIRYLPEFFLFFFFLLLRLFLPKKGLLFSFFFILLILILLVIFHLEKTSSTLLLLIPLS